MLKRTITAIVLLAVFIPLLVVKDLFEMFQVLMLGLAIFASIEMINMYEKRHKFPMIVKVFIVLSTILIYLSFLAEYAPGTLAAKGLQLFNIRVGFVPTLLIIVILFLTLMVTCHEFNGASIGRALTIILYCGLGFAAVTLLRALGLEFVIYLFCITIFTDVFAYLFGMAFGKHKMSPYISPKKTWEGAIGGSIMGTVVGVLFALFYNKMTGGSLSMTIFDNTAYMNFDVLNKGFKITFIILVTLAASIMGQIGDLVASKFKRTYDIKDYSNIFPGHGGVLDRLDSSIFVSMFIFGVIVLFNNFVM